MKIIKEKKVILLAGFFLVLWVIGCGKPKELSQKHFTIATGTKSGIYYPIGEILARIIKEKFPDTQIQVIESEGSIQNLSLLQDGKANLALVQNDIAHYAIYGENMFAGKKITGMVGLATLFPEVVHIVTRKADNLSHIKDLGGKKVAFGSENSGTYYNAQQILSKAKLWEIVQRQNFSPSDSISELENGNIDAFFFSSGVPNVNLSDMASRTEISFLSLEPDLIQELVNASPSFYFPSELDNSVYGNISSSVATVEINALLVGNSTISENDKYLLAKTLFGSLATLRAAHPVLARISTNSLRRQMTIPLSRGALEALQE